MNEKEILEIRFKWVSVNSLNLHAWAIGIGVPILALGLVLDLPTLNVIGFGFLVTALGLISFNVVRRK